MSQSLSNMVLDYDSKMNKIQDWWGANVKDYVVEHNVLQDGCIVISHVHKMYVFIKYSWTSWRKAEETLNNSMHIS